MPTTKTVQRSAREFVRDSAYATIGAGDTAVRYVRNLGLPSVRTLTDPNQITRNARSVRDSALDEFDAFAQRGRNVVESVQRSRSTQRAAGQTRVARSQVKAAATSVRRAADEQTEAAQQAAATVAKGAAVKYEDLTVEELRELARERDIEGRSEMKKDELVKELRKA